MIIYPCLTRPTEFEDRPDDFAAFEAATIVSLDKLAVPLFGPYRFHPGATGRSNDAVAAITLLVVDFDGPEHNGFDAEATGRILGDLSRFDCVVYTSHSNGERATFRAVIRPSREVRPDEWRRVWALLMSTFPDADRKDKALSQAYFLPSSHPDRAALAWSLRFVGEPLDVDAIPAFVVEDQTAPGIPREALDRWIARLRRSDDTAKHELADVVLAVREGVPFASRGGRQNAFFAALVAFLEAFPRASAATLAATLGPSLSAQAAQSPHDPGPGVKDIAGAYTRARSMLRARQEERVSPDPETELSEDVVKEVFASLGCDAPLRHLILQHDGDFYVASYGASEGLQYTVTSKNGLVTQAKDKLKAFQVPLTTQTAEGSRRMSVEDLLERYGTALDDVVKSHCEVTPLLRFDGPRRSLILPASRRRVRAPAFDPDVDRWFRMLGPAVIDWIALALDPSEPLVALILIGNAGTGKSLLAKGLTRLWSPHDPPKLSAVIGAAFNAELVRCPLLFADEDLPRDHRGNIRTAEIREILQTDRHQINAKFRNVTHLIGYPRIIAAANNDMILDFGGSALTPADIEAIQARLRVIRVPPDCAAFLKGCDVKSWVASDAIAAHALWIHENHEVAERGRFGLPSDDGGLAYSGHRLVAAATEWIVRHVLAPSRVSVAASVDFDRSVFRVRVADIVENWNGYLDQAKPSTTAIAAACGIYGGTDGWAEFPWVALVKWAERTNWCEPARIIDALAGYKSAGLRAVK